MIKDFKDLGRELAERTKKSKPKPQKHVKPDTVAIEDEETKRLTAKWDGLLASGNAITKAEIQAGHGVPEMGWMEFFMRHFENPEGPVFGESFFVWPDGSMACLKTLDTQIAKDNIETVLGESGVRYEGHRDNQKSGNQQSFAITGDAVMDLDNNINARDWD